MPKPAQTRGYGGPALNSRAEQIRITWNLDHADELQHDVLKPVFSSYWKVWILAHRCALEENRWPQKPSWIDVCG